MNQKINKTLKSLQSTEQDPAASSSSFAQKDSLLFLLMGLTPNIQQAKLGTHLRGKPVYSIWWRKDNIQYEQNDITDIFLDME